MPWQTCGLDIKVEQDETSRRLSTLGGAAPEQYCHTDIQSALGCCRSQMDQDRGWTSLGGNGWTWIRALLQLLPTYMRSYWQQ